MSTTLGDADRTTTATPFPEATELRKPLGLTGVVSVVDCDGTLRDWLGDPLSFRGCLFFAPGGRPRLLTVEDSVVGVATPLDAG